MELLGHQAGTYLLQEIKQQVLELKQLEQLLVGLHRQQQNTMMVLLGQVEDLYQVQDMVVQLAEHKQQEFTQ